MRDGKSVPVDSVSFEDAIMFCQKLTQREQSRLPRGWVFRLPTEAEWEAAARAGQESPFSFGMQLIYGQQALFSLDADQNSPQRLGEEDLSRPRMEKNLPYPVGSTTANAFGLQDCHGNVWEWVADYFEPGYRWPAGGRGPERGDQYVIKGGSWKEPAARCRSASRQGRAPTTRQEDLGFRIVLSPPRTTSSPDSSVP
jgi:formylglycine-generating enzyme required for sulfatase activity